MAARFENNANPVTASAITQRQRRRPRKARGPPHALKLPNTNSHRRRVSSKFSVAQMTAALSSASSARDSPYLDQNAFNAFPDTRKVFSDRLTVDTNHSARERSTSGGSGDDRSELEMREIEIVHSRPRGMSRDSMSGISGNHSANLMKLPLGTPIGDDEDEDDIDLSRMTSSAVGDEFPKLVGILTKEPQERTEQEVDILVAFFEQYQIMTEDVYVALKCFIEMIHWNVNVIDEIKDILV